MTDDVIERAEDAIDKATPVGLTDAQHDALAILAADHPDAKVVGYFRGPIIRRGDDFRHIDVAGRIRPVPPAELKRRGLIS